MCWQAACTRCQASRRTGACAPPCWPPLPAPAGCIPLLSRSPSGLQGAPPPMPPCSPARAPCSGHHVCGCGGLLWRRSQLLAVALAAARRRGGALPGARAGLCRRGARRRLLRAAATPPHASSRPPASAASCPPWCLRTAPAVFACALDAGHLDNWPAMLEPQRGLVTGPSPRPTSLCSPPGR